ncbi:competence protein ComJ [Bordetella sp. H567]|uniref:23S rRNA (adenine(2030)-N(6))-methyltransferase RlmJ n=1 Tax=Bordetella sp. H567 TaxID=1697043 RepID=UPI00081C9C39|nr:23S rRNA (adenine(2030)-N(6))-methyltransferase RlmJ [Bordetella sp. H567]AOB31609.1 competence protein ComJ [Bordetella sp. H567]
MFSYRHAFHAGNHADVLKHAILIHVLDYLGQKDTPYWVIDTHAGAGLYRLDSDWANKNAEFADGIGRLWDRTDLPPLLARYMECMRQYNPNGQLRHYPGSPWLALDGLREHDRLRLFERHPTEAEVLVGNLEKRGGMALRQATIFDTDGFEGMKALLPPPPRRGLVVIDPSYEDKQDYRHVALAVKEGLKRFATGTYAVWYPQVQRRESTELPRQLEKLGAQRWLHASLSVRKPATDGFGLHGSGMFLVNPPWTLGAQLKEALPWLKNVLAQDERARYTLDVHMD